MSRCLCNVDFKTKPVQACMMCVSKHINTAAMLLNTGKSDRITAAAQLNLAVLHLSENRKDAAVLINSCQHLIKILLDGEDCLFDLKELSIQCWKLAHGEKTAIRRYPDIDLNENSFSMAVLRVSTAIELLKHELRI